MELLSTGPMSSIIVQTAEKRKNQKQCAPTPRKKRAQSLLESSEPTVDTARTVPSTELTQLIVDTTAKTLQLCFQTIVKPGDGPSIPIA